MDLKNVSLFEDGHLSDESAGLYVDALLDKELSDLNPDLRSHVQDCPECKDKILEIYSFYNSTGEAENTIAMPGIFKEVNQTPSARIIPANLRRLAAVFFFMAVFLSAYFLVFQNGPIWERATTVPDDPFQHADREEPGSQDRNGTQASTSEKEEDPLPQLKKTMPERVKRNFRVNRNLEYMVDSNYRSTSVEILTPANGDTLGSEIRFSWKALSAAPLMLKILNNRNEILYSYRVNAGQGQAVFEFNQPLKRGLYYWKLELGHDLVHVGKFYIRRSATSPKG